ncbi:MAG: hypothetical protein HKN23_05565 [Verrucomicrobiales bacterium]|nr:hypothetical protein [Verrucomicrobiales bacterium]
MTSGRSILQNRLWRLGICFAVAFAASLLFQFVIEAPFNPVDALFLIPFSLLWAPLLSFPFLAFGIWWILDKRLPLFVLVIPFLLAAYCGRLFVGSPPEMTAEERRVMEETHGKEFLEQHDANRPGYKRKIFPPF